MVKPIYEAPELNGKYSERQFAAIPTSYLQDRA